MFIQRYRRVTAWFTIGVGVKRWLLVLIAGVAIVAFGITHAILNSLGIKFILQFRTLSEILFAGLTITSGFALVIVSVVKLSWNIL